jgi:glycosyltransferase involved in cell wall biosynthesis
VHQATSRPRTDPRAQQALTSRLTVAAGALGTTLPQDEDPVRSLARLLAGADGGALTTEQAWLVLVAASGCFPEAEDVLRLRRLVVTDPLEAVAADLLDPDSPGARRRLELERAAPVVDVDFTARHDLSTGVQRVVRRAASRWHTGQGARLVVWSADRTSWRPPTATEVERIHRPAGERGADPHEPEPEVVVAPWRVPVLVPEVAHPDVVPRLRGLVRSTTGPTTMIGYDCIPVVSADLLDPVEGTKFVQYLSVLKHCDRVLAISEAAAEEFAGFVDMLPAQGLPGPVVHTVPLPTITHHVQADAASVAGATGPPEVLVVGSHDARKNHEAVLAAAERLWRDGLRFRLVFAGAAGTGSHELRATLRRAQHEGRDLVELGRVSDAELDARYAAARCTLFPSVHEGFGLPVVESLSHGVPAITSSRGATAELDATGAVLLVDPLDDVALAEALRRLLVDDDLHARMRDAAGTRTGRTWDSYAEQAWALATADLP